MAGANNRRSRQDRNQRNNQEVEQTNNQEVNQTENTTTGNNKETGCFVPKSTLGVIKSVGGFVAGAAVVFISWSVVTIMGIKTEVSNIQHLEKNMAEMQSGINEIDNKMETMKEELDGIKNDLYGSANDKEGNGLLGDVRDLKDIMSAKKLYTSDEVLGIVENASSIQPNDTNLVKSSINNNMIVGTDSEGNEYTGKQLTNEKILFMYTEDDKEVYFYGQFNENYNWDGYCVTNVYNSDGTLFGICESNFDDGSRIDYKSFYYDEGEWIYTDRKCFENKNSGISKIYSMNSDKMKDFTDSNVKVIDLMNVDEFVDSQKPVLKSFYNGDTSNDKYNDDSGNAYYISYFDDGTVKTLYQGKFLNGKFDDDTGSAWYITRDEDTAYMYFKGIFESGSIKEEGDYNFENPVGLERIREIIGDKEFESELKWGNF